MLTKKEQDIIEYMAETVKELLLENGEVILETRLAAFQAHDPRKQFSFRVPVALVMKPHGAGQEIIAEIGVGFKTKFTSSGIVGDQPDMLDAAKGVG